MIRPGDDVVVEFDGEECLGEVLEVRGGWFLCRVLIDPVADFGSISPRLDPVSLVMVREKDVRLAEVV